MLTDDYYLKHLGEVTGATTTPEMLAWMDRNRRRFRVSSLRTQLERARARGSKNTLVALDTLEEILNEA